MALNSISDAMEWEAIKVPANAHPYNSLPSKSIVLKLLKPFFGIILSYLKPISVS